MNNIFKHTIRHPNYEGMKFLPNIVLIYLLASSTFLRISFLDSSEVSSPIEYHFSILNFSYPFYSAPFTAKIAALTPLATAFEVMVADEIAST